MLQKINADVRHLIYKMLLQPRVEIDIMTRIEPAILRTCRQFYNETKPILYGNTIAVYIGMYFSDEDWTWEARLGSRRNSEAHQDDREDFELIAKFRSLHVHVRCDAEDDEPWVRYKVAQLCRRIHGLKRLEITLDCRQPPPNDIPFRESYYQCKFFRCPGACSIERDTYRDYEFPAPPTIPQTIVNILRPFSMLRSVSQVIFHEVPTEFAQDLENKVRSTTPNPAFPIHKILQRDIRKLEAAELKVRHAMETDRDSAIGSASL